MDLTFILFDTKGRISRSQFWMGMLALLAASFLIFSLEKLLISMKVKSLALIASCMVMFLYANYCLFIKRLHDRGRNGKLFTVYLVAH